MTISPYLKIKKRTQPEWLIFIIIVLPFLFGTLIGLLSMPTAIKYLNDVCWLFLFLLIGFNLNRGKIAIEKSSAPAYVWIIGFLVFTLLVYIFSYQSFLYYLWGFRNNFRFYILFFACILFLNKENIDEYLKMFDVIFWINSLICVIQFFAFGFKGDFLGGLFGVEKGCNAYLNIFMVMVVCKSILYYLDRRENILLCVSKCGIALIVAAMAELKFFFVEFVIIALISILLSERSSRKVNIVIIGALMLLLGTSIVATIFPHFEGFLSLDFFIKNASSDGYSQAGQVNRLTTIPVISEQILTEFPQKLFGLGLGNCDTSAYDFLNTPFYDTYSYLRYEWFSSAFIFLETGFIGLIMFFGFYVLVGIKSFLMAKENRENKIYCHMGIIAAVMCVLLGIYNSSLRTEAGYMIYFMLAIPFIAKKDTVMK